jgi:hypothetical protein
MSGVGLAQTGSVWYIAAMALLIVAAVITLVSLVTSHFLPDRFRWRKILLLVVGIVGAALSFSQGYSNLERADGLQHELGTLEQKQDYWDVSKLSALGLSGIAGKGLAEHSAINDLIAPYVKLEPTFRIDCRREAVAAFGSVITMNEKFPFAYYYSGLCTRANNLLGWQQDFAKAKSILEITTNIPGHNQNHDEVLKAIETDDPNNFIVNVNPA